MKFIVITFLLLCLPLVHALDVKNITYENETIMITPLIETFYEDQITLTKVFKIQRLDPTNNTLIFNYSLIFNNKTTYQNQTISKTINKYTSANTGSININSSGNYSLYFKSQDQIINWNFSIIIYSNHSIFNQTTIKNLSDNKTQHNETITDCDLNYTFYQINMNLLLEKNYYYN